MKDVCTENAEMLSQFLLMTYAITDKSIYDNKTESGQNKGKQDFIVKYGCQSNKCTNQWVKEQGRSV